MVYKGESYGVGFFGVCKNEEQLEDNVFEDYFFKKTPTKNERFSKLIDKKKEGRQKSVGQKTLLYRRLRSSKNIFYNLLRFVPRQFNECPRNFSPEHRKADMHGA